jgi:branched-chain amino acid transport system substrate-binding protein
LIRTIIKRNITQPKQPASSALTAYCLLFAVCCFLFTACTDPDLVCDDALGCIRITANDPIRLAALLALSGDGAYLGQDSLRGVEMALAERDNLLLGHSLELAAVDTACVIETGRSAAVELVTDPLLVGIVGDTCSAVTEAIIPTVNQAGLLMISPSSVQPDLPQADVSPEGIWQMSFFRTVPSNLWQAVIAAEFAVEKLGVVTAAIIYDETENSMALQQTFADTFTAMGGRITFIGQLAVGQMDVQEVVTAVNTGQPELLYLSLFEPEANLVINNLAEGHSLLLLGPDTLFLPTFAESTGPAVQGMALTTVAPTGAAYEEFLDQWLALYGEAPSLLYHAHAYDATTILLNAVEDVAQAGRNNSLLIGRQALREAVAETELDGLTGRLLCEAAECASPAAIGIYQLTVDQISGEVWPPPLLWVPPDPGQQ